MDNLVNFQYSKERLEYIFREYGEIKNPKRVVENILKNREIKSAVELTKIINQVAPKAKKINPATLYFQAIRIEVNEELKEIELLLDNLEKRAKRGELKGGRVALITFHSLEDRIVKSRFKGGLKIVSVHLKIFACECGKKTINLVKLFTKKPNNSLKGELNLIP